MFLYSVPGPNEALLITGMGAKVDNTKAAQAARDSDAPAVKETQDFKVVTGKGAFIVPFLQRGHKLPLDTRRVDLGSSEYEEAGVLCVSKEAIPVLVEAVLVFKVGDDRASIVNAGRRFLGKSDEEMNETIKEMAHGHLRSIVAGLSVEELIRGRDSLTEQVRAATAVEMQKLGLHIDSMQLKQIRDVPSGDGSAGYIANLGKPHAAAVAARARIAEADRDREAVEREQEAQALAAEARKESEVRQARAQAETERARAEAQQAGPLAEATARQAVVRADTAAAELEAALAEQQLQTQVRKPADAEAYRLVTLADADRQTEVARATAAAAALELDAQARAKATELDAEATSAAFRKLGDGEASAIRAKALAEADGVRERGLAEAAGIEARQQALADNPEGVIAQQVAENLPAIVAAAAAPFNNVGSFTVLDGAEGVQKALMSTLGTATAVLPMAKDIFGGLTGQTPTPSNAAATNGAAADAPAPQAPAAEVAAASAASVEAAPVNAAPADAAPAAAAPVAEAPAPEVPAEPVDPLSVAPEATFLPPSDDDEDGDDDGRRRRRKQR